MTIADRILDLLADAPDGLKRRELVSALEDLTPGTVDATLHDMGKAGRIKRDPITSQWQVSDEPVRPVVKPERVSPIIASEMMAPAPPVVTASIREPAARAESRMSRKQLIDAVAACVLQDRAAEYGSLEDNFTTIADLWSVYWQRRGLAKFEPFDVAVMMALLKVGRLSANPKHADSWVDLAGYAACGVECATRPDPSAAQP
jgi:hypothetical protein